MRENLCEICTHPRAGNSYVLHEKCALWKLCWTLLTLLLSVKTRMARRVH